MKDKELLEEKDKGKSEKHWKADSKRKRFSNCFTDKVLFFPFFRLVFLLKVNWNLVSSLRDHESEYQNRKKESKIKGFQT